MRIFVLGLSLLVLLSSPAASQDLDALDSAIKNRLAQSKVPGLTIAVLATNGTISERGYGARSSETGEPVISGMLFRPGSVTKTWTAAALLKVMEGRGLSVRQPIGSFVIGLRPELARLTVHQLLSHTSGLADSGATGGSLDEAALSLSVGRSENYQFFGEPGDIFSYSDPGIQLAGYLLEQLTGKKYADAIDELILKPIGAQRSTFRPMMAITYPVAVGHTVGPAGKAAVIRPMDHGVQGAPSGYSFATSSDLVRFAQMILADGKAPDCTQVLSTSVVSAITTRYAAVTETAGAMGYGYGLWVDRENGQRVWHHGGGLDGFNAQLTMLPDTKVAIAVIANASDSIGLVNDIVAIIRGQVFRGPSRPVTSRVEATPAEPVRPKGKQPVPEPLASQLVGQWGGGEYVFTVRRDGRKLTYLVGNSVIGTLHRGDANRLPLATPSGGDGGYVGVIRDGGGKPIYLTWSARATSRLRAGARTKQ